MNKAEFIEALAAELEGLPAAEITKSLEYYGEVIDDRVECGMTEDEAVAALDELPVIRERLIEDTPLPVLVRGSIKTRTRPGVLLTILLILGSPLWISFLAVAASLVLTLFIVFWTLIAVLWVLAAVLWVGFGALCVASVGFIAYSVLTVVTGGAFINALACVGLAIASAGAAILMFFAALYAVKGMAVLTAFCARKLSRAVKGIFTRKGAERK